MSALRDLPSPQAMRAVLARVDAAMSERAQRFVADRLALLPAHWRRYVAEEFCQRGGESSPIACRWLRAATECAESGKVRLSACDEDLRVSAVVAAREAASIAQLTRGGREVIDSLRHVCKRWGVAAVDPVRRSDGAVDQWPAVRRMICPHWWRRRLRSAVVRQCEEAAIAAGLVRRGLWPYASQDTVERRQQQRRRLRDAVAAADLIDQDTGEVVELSAVVEGSVSNPAIRRGELMTRVRGCDELARESGWRCEFWTLTAPSRFHPQTTVAAVSERNPRFDGSTPRQAQSYLCRVWSRARAAWKRRGLQVLGLRTAEPHHDGTPHWHLIVYGPDRDLRYARRLLRVYALRDAGGEPGARARRFVVLQARGLDGAAYAAKYISKNIDGYGMEGERDGETGRRVSSAARRVDAWAAAWRIRQFQFFGLPVVGGWRVLRQIRTPCAEPEAVVEQARVAADGGDWRAYCRAWWGGLKLVREECERLTQYGDAAAARVVGVEGAGRVALRAVRNWLVRWGAGGGRSLVSCQ